MIEAKNNSMTNGYKKKGTKRAVQRGRGEGGSMHR
jgi:hypothetical protein